MFPIIILGAIIAAAVFKQGTTLVNALNFTPKRFILNKNSLGLLETRATMILNISNNSNVKATIDSVVGSIIVSGIAIGRYEILQPFTIPAKNNIDLTVTVFVNNIDFVNNIAMFIKSGKTPAIALSGDIRTNLGTQSFQNQMFKEVKLF